jgi:hypothetical protein
MAKQQKCAHDEVEVRLACSECDEEFERRSVSRAEMEARATDLPDREAMSLVNANLAAPINLAAALNVLSDNSMAGAGAAQTAPITQGTAPFTMPGAPTTPTTP